MVNQDIINFREGKVVYGRWKVISKLGAGGCGAVFKVQDTKHLAQFAALKAEKNDLDDGGVLKLEAEVFKKLQHRKHCIRMLDSSKRVNYSFIVMTLCDRDLMSLKRSLGETKFSEGTIMRMAVHCLYAIKQIHEIGYVHRDVKPGNMVIGTTGRERRMVFLIDYGMVRSYVKEETPGVYRLRKPRPKVLLRGTLRYCSLNVHNRIEQGRCDDIVSLMYMMGELYKGLPWNRDTDEKEIKKKKETLADEAVFKECPPEFIEILKHLRPLKYGDRPDYFKIYEILMSGLKRINCHFSDPYEWEKDDLKSNISELRLQTGIEPSEREKATKKPLPLEELEFKMYPTTAPEPFKEIVMKF